MKLLIINIPFQDWIKYIKKCNKCICINDKDIKNYNTSEYKIIPICVNDYIKYNNFENNIFKNSIENIEILNNKSKFGKFMLDKYIEHIPAIYYYNFENETFFNNTLLKKKLILKPNEMCGGSGIKIISRFNNKETNCIIQEYISHNKYYVGHFLILNGIIYNKIYFSSNYKYNNRIKKGAIINYKIENELDIDDSIFYKIFNDLNYSGFADSDFIIVNNKIIIFEINPRPGGSLIKNEKYFNIFIDKLLTLLNIQ
jgi:predicted ATP-grasp superfamily ATP-dependent carboligase